MQLPGFSRSASEHQQKPALSIWKERAFLGQHEFFMAALWRLERFSLKGEVADGKEFPGSSSCQVFSLKGRKKHKGVFDEYVLAGFFHSVRLRGEGRLSPRRASCLPAAKQEIACRHGKG